MDIWSLYILCILFLVIDGKLEWSYELGSGPAQIRLSTINVSDGQPHTVVLRRQANEGSIELDGVYSARGHSGGTLTQLNTSGNIFIGMHDFNDCI